MATLTIRRTRSFRRGDGIIQIFIDGKAFGNLRNDVPLRIDLPAGIYEVRPMIYGMRGSRQTVQLNEDDAQTVLIDGTIELKSFRWEAILFILVCTIPDNALHGYVFPVKWVMYALILAYDVYRLRNYRRDFLKMEVIRRQEPAQAA